MRDKLKLEDFNSYEESGKTWYSFSDFEFNRLDMKNFHVAFCVDNIDDEDGTGHNIYVNASIHDNVYHIAEDTAMQMAVDRVNEMLKEVL